jgi:dinuclear metal center YbgI/SA1388 family protein
MKTNEIIEIIENVCPKSLAYSWDNVGLLCGDGEKDINSVFVTLDTNINTVKEAIEKHADMIVSHHPIFFSPLKRIDYTTAQGQMIKLLIENNIPLYAAHTNMDTAKGGINDRLAKMFSLTDVDVLECHTAASDVGLGRIGKLKSPTAFNDFAARCSEILNTHLRAAGDFDKIIKTVAVASGSCCEVIPLAAEKGADVIVTADMKYHNMIDMTELGICVVDAGHYPTEICVMDIFEDILKGTGVEIIKSENKDIFRFI